MVQRNKQLSLSPGTGDAEVALSGDEVFNLKKRFLPYELLYKLTFPIALGDTRARTHFTILWTCNLMDTWARSSFLLIRPRGWGVLGNCAKQIVFC